jgi:hypothetical protein
VFEAEGVKVGVNVKEEVAVAVGIVPEITISAALS